MFIFYHRQQTEDNYNYYKGILFEHLLREYLVANGYEVDLRRKRNSLEYDLECRDRAVGTRVIGEAKAHEKSISGEMFTSFVGKLVPRGLMNGSVRGLFLSISALTPEADDYYSTVSNLGLTVRTGRALHDEVRDSLKLPNYEPLASQIEEQGLYAQTSYILRTENDTYVVIVARSDVSAAASHFAVFQKNGRLLADRPFLLSLANAVKELQSLQPIISHVAINNISQRIIPSGLAVGNEWTDYRLPAAPKVFIGRQDFIKRIMEHIQPGCAPNIIQIKSRSGVGKSSALAFIEQELTKQGISVEIHDARDIKSVLDIYTVIQRFTKSSSLPSDFREVQQQLAQFASNNSTTRAAFLVDQFESTFSKPDVFQAYESIANLLLDIGNSLYMVLARKNDQLTTYDDSRISLERINSVSQSYELHDFEFREAAELIDRINKSASKSVGKDILAYVMSFAQGFPWLIKRTMNHILRLTNKGVLQKNLIATGLRLDDLFDEELEELDEIEKDYLIRIARRLPADYNQLQRQFDEDPLLPKILEKLTGARLFRLTGATYDTYNDVFKEYLIYEKLPEFRESVIYRQFPTSVLKVFHTFVQQGGFRVDELENEFSQKTAFNQIRELRNFNLIKREIQGGLWKVPQTVIDIYHQGRLGEYIRRQLADNDVVNRLIDRAAKGNPLNMEEISQYLQNQFPFLDASKKTWNIYATILCSWVTLTRLLDIENDYLVLPKDDRTKIIEDLGNLSNTRVSGLGRRGRRGRTVDTDKSIFLPTASFASACNIINNFQSGITKLSSEEKKALSDLRRLGWITNGQLKIKSVDELRNEAEIVLQQDVYKSFWIAASQENSLVEQMKIIAGSSYTDATIIWKVKKLLNWGKELNLIPNKRFLYSTTKKRGRGKKAID